MEHTLIGAAVPEEGDGHPSQLLELGGQGRTHCQGNAGRHHAVGPQHSLAHVGDVHRAAFSLVGTGGPAEQLGHHQLGINPFGDAVAVPPVGAADIVVVAKVGTNAGGHRLLTG